MHVRPCLPHLVVLLHIVVQRQRQLLMRQHLQAAAARRQVQRDEVLDAALVKGFRAQEAVVAELGAQPRLWLDPAGRRGWAGGDVSRARGTKGGARRRSLKPMRNAESRCAVPAAARHMISC